MVKKLHSQQGMKFWALDTYVVVIGFSANTNPERPNSKRVYQSSYRHLLN